MEDLTPPSPAQLTKEFHTDLRAALLEMKEDISPKNFLQDQREILKGGLQLPKALFRLQFELPKKLLAHPEKLTEALTESADLSQGTLDQKMEKLRK